MAGPPPPTVHPSLQPRSGGAAHRRAPMYRAWRGVTNTSGMVKQIRPLEQIQQILYGCADSSDTIKCPIMARTKSSHLGHCETSVPAIWDIMRLSYMGTVWDHSGHYETFSWDITRPPLETSKNFLPKAFLEVLGRA